MLKQLIQRLLDSRTTPEEAGHSAMPSASETVLLTQNDAFQSWGNIHQGVAADDGYVNIFARSVNNTTSEMRVLTSGMTFSSAQTGAEKDMACSAPVAKGQSYAVKGIQVKMIKIIFVKALGAIGGGYNHFVRRTLSCLRPSFNFSQRSFFKVNIPTLLINADQVPVCKARQSQKTARRTLWRHSQAGLSLRLAQTVRQTTHGLGLKTPPEELHTSPMQFANTKRLLSQCKKEMFLLLTSALITRTKAPFCLSLLKQQNNLGTGGVTC